MRSGFAILNKPPCMTSSDVVVRVRRAFPKGTRVGHMGTLDPGASGVLPIGVGKAARLFDYAIDKDKEYIAEMKLGEATDTQDRFGSVVERSPAVPGRRDIADALARFVGEIRQIPPAYSAVKKDGRRLYQLARAGEDAQVPARVARIEAIELLAHRGDRALLRVVCGRGTYIRTLIHDIGETLGCWAHMSYLVRTRSGPFRIEDAVSVDTFRAQGGEFPLAPMDAPLAHLPRLRLEAGDAFRVRNGTPLPAALLPALGQGEACRAYLEDAFAGILQRENDLLRWKAMLLEEMG